MDAIRPTCLRASSTSPAWGFAGPRSPLSATPCDARLPKWGQLWGHPFISTSGLHPWHLHVSWGWGQEPCSSSTGGNMEVAAGQATPSCARASGAGGELSAVLFDVGAGWSGSIPPAAVLRGLCAAHTSPGPLKGPQISLPSCSRSEAAVLGAGHSVPCVCHGCTPAPRG